MLPTMDPRYSIGTPQPGENKNTFLQICFIFQNRQIEKAACRTIFVGSGAKQRLVGPDYLAPLETARRYFSPILILKTGHFDAHAQKL